MGSLTLCLSLQTGLSEDLCKQLQVNPGSTWGDMDACERPKFQATRTLFAAAPMPYSQLRTLAAPMSYSQPRTLAAPMSYSQPQYGAAAVAPYAPQTLAAPMSYSQNAPRSYLPPQNGAAPERSSSSASSPPQDAKSELKKWL